jgi:hypothetical protein
VQVVGKKNSILAPDLSFFSNSVMISCTECFAITPVFKFIKRVPALTSSFGQDSYPAKAETDCLLRPFSDFELFSNIIRSLWQ